jgi:hypothetical protein
MLASSIAAASRPLAVPHDVRAALEHIVSRSLTSPFAIDASVTGDPALAAMLGRYAVVRDSPARLIALNATGGQLREAVTEHLPETVTVLARGGLAGPLAQFRRNRFDLNRDLLVREWRGLGYARLQSAGFHGGGAAALALLERAARRLNRPDLADRCRVVMLRVMSASGAPTFSTVVVHDYRRER